MTVAIRFPWFVLSILVISACGGSVGGAAPSMSRLAELGEKIFADASLASSGVLACATCHDADHALAGATLEPVPRPLASTECRPNTPQTST